MTIDNPETPQKRETSLSTSTKSTLKTARKIFKTDLPYDAQSWPTVTSSDARIMIEMLCRLLAPISTHRSFYAAPSTLRRKRKRTRTTTAISDPNPIPTPPLPEIAQHITTGINSTTVHLEKSVCFRRLKPSSPTAPQPTTKSPNTLALIFLPTPPSTSPPLQFEHLPTLAHLSSEEPALIIPLPATAEKEIAAAVGLPRVSALGVMADAPGAEALIELCRRKVKPMGLGWVKDAVRGQWRGVKVVGQAG